MRASAHRCADLSVWSPPRSRVFWLALAGWLAQLWVFVLPLLPHAQQAGLAQCVQLQQALGPVGMPMPLHEHSAFSAPEPSAAHPLQGHDAHHHPVPVAQTMSAQSVRALDHGLHAHPKKPHASDHDQGHAGHDCGFCLVLGHLALGGVALGLGGLLRRYSLQVRVWLRQLWLRRWRFSHPLSTAPPCFSSLGLRPVLCRAA